MTRDGGAAFPSQRGNFVSGGLSKRELIAMHAMAAMLGFVGVRADISTGDLQANGMEMPIARGAVRYADALLAALAATTMQPDPSVTDSEDVR